MPAHRLPRDQRHDRKLSAGCSVRTTPTSRLSVGRGGIRRRAGLDLASAGHDRGVAQDRDRWHSWAIPIAIVVGGVALRFTDRRWLVDLLDVPGLSETGNFALGFVVGAGWYVFPLIVRLVGKLSGRRSPRAARATVVLSIFAALGAVAIAAFPNRYRGAYNEALDDQVPGFSAGILAGSIPLLILGLVIWIGSKVLAWRARPDRQRQRRIDDSRD
jgi:hypothetical protein